MFTPNLDILPFAQRLPDEWEPASIVSRTLGCPLSSGVVNAREASSIMLIMQL